VLPTKSKPSPAIGNLATPDWRTVKSTENYERRFVIAFPNEILPKGAHIYQGFGLEHALWSADGSEEPTFERNRSHEYIAREVKAVRQAVGGIEIANFAKHEFRGADTRAYLETIPVGYALKPGRLTLTPMLTPKGKLYG